MRLPLHALALAAAAACAATAPEGATTPDVAERVRRVAAILDYVAADYGGAVVDGRIAEPAEYAEQLEFLDDAGALAAALPPPPRSRYAVATDLARVRAEVTARAPADEVAAVARAARTALLDAYGIVLAPTAPPSLDRGRQLYADNCVACHGPTGGGDGPRAHELNPPPRSFRDPEVMADLSPARAFNALTDGIPDTGMASFGLLPAADRWSLAYYVFTLRHDPSRTSRGAEAFARADGAVVATATRLAGATDGELLDAFARAGLSEPDRADALAYVRAVAAYQSTGAPMDPVRQRVRSAVGAYAAGEPARALSELSAAYLDAFEPHEAALSARDPDAVTAVESAFLALRGAIERRAPLADVEQLALRLGVRLDAAEDALAGRGGGMAFASALAILLREGLEGALLVLLLLGWARRAGAGERDARAVHAGWLGAVALGAATWFAAGSLIARLGGAHRELIEGIVALLAAGVLLMASHFVLARLDARRRVAALRARLDAATSTSRRRWVLASLAFIAVYREAFEVVLFLQALMLDARASGAAVAGGAAVALVALVGLVAAMRKLGDRLKPGPLLTAAGALLCALAVVLAGKGVRSLQEAGVISIAPLSLPRFDWIGLYPTLQTVGAQLVALVAFAAIALWSVARSRARAA